MSVQGDSIENSLQRTVSVTSLNPDGSPQCTTHRKRMKFFCSKHELLLCSICAVKRHRHCDEVTCPYNIQQYFYGCKNSNFQMKNYKIFLIFAQNIDCGYKLEPPQSNVLCFRAKIRKNIYPCTPQFHYKKVGCMGYKSHGHVILMLSSDTGIAMR